MLRSLPLSAAMLASALLLGCGEQPTPSEPATAPGPSLRTEQNPDGSGASVIRFNDHLVLLLQDQARGLTVGLGLTAQELEELLAGCPNEPPAPEELPAQIVLGPNDFAKYLAKGELGVVIWPAVIFAEFGLCAEEDLPPLLAAGTARFLSSDNDNSFTLTRAKAVALRANGTVTELATGQELTLLVRFQFVVGPDFDFFHAPSTEIILTD